MRPGGRSCLGSRPVSEGCDIRKTDTAYEAWDVRWQSEGGRADWLEPDPEVVRGAGLARAAGARRALDLGAGVGRHALHLAAAGFETVAMDASPAGIEHLRAEAARRGLAVGMHLGLMTALPFADGAFDYVLSHNVIYHGDATVVRAAIAEIRRVLRPGGLYQGTMLSKRNANYGAGTEVAPDTFVKAGEADKDHPHFYCDAAGLVALFAGFELLELRDRAQESPGGWHWYLIAERGES